LTGVCCRPVIQLFNISILHHGFNEPFIRLHYSINIHQNNNYFQFIFVTAIIPAQPPEGEGLGKLENHKHGDHMEKVFHLAHPVRQSLGDGGCLCAPCALCGKMNPPMPDMTRHCRICWFCWWTERAGRGIIPAWRSSQLMKRGVRRERDPLSTEGRHESKSSKC
jgi:hypothetical protein